MNYGRERERERGEWKMEDGRRAEKETEREEGEEVKGKSCEKGARQKLRAGKKRLTLETDGKSACLCSGLVRE